MYFKSKCEFFYVYFFTAILETSYGRQHNQNLFSARIHQFTCYNVNEHFTVFHVFHNGCASLGYLIFKFLNPGFLRSIHVSTIRSSTFGCRGAHFTGAINSRSTQSVVQRCR